jgi:hypothetical protein
MPSEPLRVVESIHTGQIKPSKNLQYKLINCLCRSCFSSKRSLSHCERGKDTRSAVLNGKVTITARNNNEFIISCMLGKQKIAEIANDVILQII